MRIATLAFAALGLLLIGTAAARAQAATISPAPATYLAAPTGQVVVTPVRRWAYGPGWGYGYAYPRYYGYRPYRSWYGGPTYYYGYNPGYYPGYGYYQPYGFGFSYVAPGRAFGFGF